MSTATAGQRKKGVDHEQLQRQFEEFTLEEVRKLVPAGKILHVNLRTVCCACTNCIHWKNDNSITFKQKVMLGQTGDRIVLVHLACPEQPGMKLLMPTGKDLPKLLAQVKGVELKTG